MVPSCLLLTLSLFTICNACKCEQSTIENMSVAEASALLLVIAWIRHSPQILEYKELKLVVHKNVFSIIIWKLAFRRLYSYFRVDTTENAMQASINE